MIKQSRDYRELSIQASSVGRNVECLHRTRTVLRDVYFAQLARPSGVSEDDKKHIATTGDAAVALEDTVSGRVVAGCCDRAAWRTGHPPCKPSSPGSRDIHLVPQSRSNWQGWFVSRR